MISIANMFAWMLACSPQQDDETQDASVLVERVNLGAQIRLDNTTLDLCSNMMYGYIRYIDPI